MVRESRGRVGSFIVLGTIAIIDDGNLISGGGGGDKVNTPQEGNRTAATATMAAAAAFVFAQSSDRSAVNGRAIYHH